MIKYINFTSCHAGFKRVCGIGMCESTDVTKEQCESMPGGQWSDCTGQWCTAAGSCMVPYN